MRAARPNLMMLAVAGFVSATASAAFALSDAATGLSVEPPEPYRAEVMGAGRYDVAFGVMSTTGQPPVAGTSPALCKIVFKKAFRAEPVEQKLLNQRFLDEGWLKSMRREYTPSLNIQREETFVQGDMLGIELTTIPKAGPNASQVRVHVSILETTKGRMVQTCATPEASFDGALAEFRKIRSTITLPK